MKTRIISYVLMAAMSGGMSAGCYEDKGNYNYRDVNELVIEMEEGSNLPPFFRLSMGGVVKIHPVLKFINGTGNCERLEYKWELIMNEDEGEVYTREDWNTLDFEWKPDFLIVNGRLLLTVTDPETGIRSFGYANISVSSRYDAAGAMVLSEQEGKSRLSFIKGTEFDGTIPTKFEVFDNIYVAENGRELPQGAVRLHEHFCTDASTSGQILVLTRNGAVDVSGLDFKQDIDLREAFDGQNYPEGFGYASDALFMNRVDLLMDSEGYVYSRLKNTSDLFHSGYFLANRLSVEGEEEPLSGCRAIPAPYKNLKAGLLFDGGKRRFVLVGDTETGSWDGPVEENAGRAVALSNPTDRPEGDVPEEFLRLDGMDADAEILAIDYFRNESYYNGMGYSVVFHKGGKTYFQEFTVEKVYGVFGYSAVAPAIHEIKGIPGKPTFAYAQPYYKGASFTNNPLLFCAVGKDLYVYDRSNPSVPAVKYEPRTPEGTPVAGAFSGDIVSMNCENYGGRWGAVGLSDGRVLILKTIQATHGEEQILYYDSGSHAYGTIRQVLCKTGGANW